VRSFLVRLDSQKDRERVVPRIFRNALRARIAVVAPARGALFRVADCRGRYFRRIEAADPHRIVGVYQLRGDRDALLEALMEDMRDAAATRLA
jgi:hypothetical protein